jgi:hypothetical protein
MRESELVSHEMFERFCALRGIRAEPIPRSAMPTPDYKVWIGPKRYIVELKQLDPNDEDERQRRELETVGQTAWEITPGKRARSKIGHAKRQLTRWAKCGVPALLVLFNNTRDNFGSYLDSYDIKTAMHGSDDFLFARCGGFSQPLGWVSGGEPTIPASFSAVGILFPYHPDDPDKAPYLVLYHNDSADVPLDPECVAAVTEHQYRWQDRRPHEIGCWVHPITGQYDDVFGALSET